MNKYRINLPDLIYVTFWDLYEKDNSLLEVNIEKVANDLKLNAWKDSDIDMAYALTALSLENIALPENLKNSTEQDNYYQKYRSFLEEIRIYLFKKDESFRSKFRLKKIASPSLEVFEKRGNIKQNVNLAATSHTILYR